MDGSRTYGENLFKKYFLTQNNADLDRAIEATQDALQSMSGTNVARVLVTNDLGDFFSARYTRTLNERDFCDASSAYAESSTSLTANITQRLRAYGCLFNLHISRQEVEKALEAGVDAVKLLPALVPRSLSSADKQRVLKSAVGLASDTAALAIRFGRLVESFQILEQGRGILLGSLIDIRNMPRDLLERHPDLAQRFASFRDQLNAPESRVSPSEARSYALALKQGESRLQASAGFESLLREIREQPGFDDFLKPLAEQEIHHAASEGPILYINVSEHGCNALVIKQHTLHSVALDRLDIKSLTNQKHKLGKAGPGPREVLEWLWDTIAYPILQTLDLDSSKCTSGQQRVWWVPTQLLSRFPLHAAGYHLEKSPVSVLDSVVSSFASSIKSILHGRKNSANIQLEPKRLLLVAMEDTPRCRSLHSRLSSMRQIRLGVFVSTSELRLMSQNCVSDL